MADAKISALPASTTPLAGTEVIPLVQSGVTKNVSVANLTAGRAVSAASMTLSTGNLVIGTNGQGIDFSATPGTGTSELLNDYEEGAWTPTITCGTPGDLTVAYSTQVGFYTRIGRVVTVLFVVSTSTFTRTTASGLLLVGGLPFTALSAANSVAQGALTAQGILRSGFSQVMCSSLPNTTQLIFPACNIGTNAGIVNIEITDLPSGGSVSLRGSVSYIV